MKSSSLFIEHQCPQCGARATLEETDRLFFCPYCRVRSYLAARDFFRYRLPASAPETTPLFFIPYWRFKGMVFSAGFEGVLNHVLDVSVPAVPAPMFPASLGLRSQALKLRFVSPDASGHFVRPQRSLDEAMEEVIRRMNLTLARPVRYQCRVGETVSLIYAPFYSDQGIVDGVLNTRLPGILSEGFNSASFPGGRPRWRLRFLACLCPDCGWDLAGERDTLVLHCGNCGSAWRAAAEGFKKIHAEHLRAEEGDAVFIPFWKIRAEVKGMRLTSYADLVREANLPKVPLKEWETWPAFFWAPAFKIRPGRFLRLAVHLTLTGPQDPLIPQVPKGRAFPVTLPVKEAVEGLMPSLISFIKPQREFLERIHEISIRPQSFSLVYFPFGESSHEWIQRRFGVVIDKNTLRLAKSL